MAKKLYLATQGVNVMFVCEKESEYGLKNEALHFLAEEAKNHEVKDLQIKHVTDVKDIPDEWKGALVWGTDEDITPEGFLSTTDPEYETYLRLKKKFGDL